MPFGLGEQTLARIRAVLAAHPAVTKAVLYGSRAKGTHKPGSDIDLTLCGDAITPRDVSRIADALDALDLPYVIDLSAYGQLHHAALREHIERVGVVIYDRRAGGG